MWPLTKWNFEIPSSFQGKWKIKIDMVMLIVCLYQL